MQLVIMLYCNYGDVTVTLAGLDDLEEGLGWLIGLAMQVRHGANNFCLRYKILRCEESE
jgi:hypothetical protein